MRTIGEKVSPPTLFLEISPPGPVGGARGAGWRLTCDASGSPVPQPSSLRAAFVNEAEPSLCLAQTCASGSPVPRRRTFASAIHGRRSLRAACAFALRASLTGEAVSRSTGDPSLAN